VVVVCVMAAAVVAVAAVAVAVAEAVETRRQKFVGRAVLRRAMPCARS